MTDRPRLRLVEEEVGPTEARFEAWARARRPVLVAWVRCVRRGLPPEQCEDIASEVMLAVCRLCLKKKGMGEVPEPAELDRYANRVIRNKVIDGVRAGRRESSVPLDEELALGENGAGVEDRVGLGQLLRRAHAERDNMPEAIRASWDQFLESLSDPGDEPMSNAERGKRGRLLQWLIARFGPKGEE